jgi:hypothetical protein
MALPGLSPTGSRRVRIRNSDERPPGAAGAIALRTDAQMIRSTRTVAHAGDVEMLELQMSDHLPGFRDSVLYVVDVLGVEPRLFNHEAAARAHKGHPTTTVTAVPGY